MLELLAQSQPSGAGGMSTWGLLEWGLFAGIVTGIIGSITASIIAIMGASKANKSADTNQQNMQSLAAGQAIMAQNQTKSSSIDSPPPSVQKTALNIAANPSVPQPLEDLHLIVPSSKTRT